MGHAAQCVVNLCVEIRDFDIFHLLLLIIVGSQALLYTMDYDIALAANICCQILISYSDIFLLNHELIGNLICTDTF